jgi:phosphatidylinositol-3-phosphatase
MRRLLVLAAALTLLTGSAPLLPGLPLASADAAGLVPPRQAAAAVHADPGSSLPGLAATARISGVTKVLVIVEENHSSGQMRKGMPYLDSLGRRYGRALHYRAIRHPSEPNYLAIAGGSTFGVADDRPPSAHRIRGRSVFGQAAVRGLTAGTYAQSMRGGTCVLRGNQHRGYAVKHNPQVYFVDERAQCRRSNRDDRRFRADAAANRLPNVGMLIPNRCYDAHDCSLPTADRYLRTMLRPVLRSLDFKRGRLAVVITADEDNSRGVNDVYTVVLHAGLDRSSTKVHLTHYSLSRLLSQVSGSRPLRKARTAPDLAAAFRLRVTPAR